MPLIAKKVYLFTVLILAIFLCSPVTASHFSGPFVGAHVGGAVTLDKYKAALYVISFPGEKPPTNTLMAESFQLSQVIPTGGFNAGYDFRFQNRFLLGAELFYDFQHSSVRKNILHISSAAGTSPDGTPDVVTLQNDLFSSFSMDNVFSAALRLGLVATESTLAYFNVGIPYSKFSYKTAFKSTETDTSGINAPRIISDSFDSNTYFTGYLLGAGVEQYVYKSFSIFANYRYYHFNNYKGKLLQPSLGAVRLAITTSNYVTQHNFLIGVNSRFEV